MANNVKVKNVKIKLDGKDHELIYDMNAMCEIEDKFGDVEIAFNNLGNSNKVFNSLRFLLWAGLLHEDEKLTIRDVGKMVNFLEVDKVEQLVESLTNAIEPGIKNEIEKK
ncbi:hypothetical protein [Maledivibacter halophilus]|uniref:Phage tail assembly chaperone protein, TAC n=1 Tax=Maledivibacter halophilus TaxID=36842 RepID=A0A1T5KGN1_9FIRM|nr:hypothetical protein [Maledivibacter halophilus]SKC62528.1 hypothetical protein SAMN02194393_01762 [Maledivibacter halophilus]